MANHDDDDLLSSSNLDDFLQGDDDFMSEEQREERAANERRLARKRRLQSIQQQQQQQEKEETQDGKQIMTSNKKTSSSSSSVLINTNNNVNTQHGEGNKKMKSLQKDNNLLLNEDTDDLVNDGDDDDDDDDFDIFSSSVSPVERDNKKTKASNNNASSNKQSTTNTTDNVDTQQDWDDSEGYYKATIGEMIRLDLGNTSTATTTSTSSSAPDGDAAHVQFRVSGVIGKGVFSTVLKAATESISPNISTDIQLPPQVAIKCIRHNETMAKAAINEIKFLQRFNKNKKQQQRGGGKNNNTDHLNNSKASKNSKQQQQNSSSSSSSSAAQDGIVPLLLPIDSMIPEYRGHTLLIFPYMPFNLRDVLTKFGKGVGLSLTAVRSYFGQLLAAATHLKQHNIIHCDLKPDNILVSQDFSTVRLCDFGSAVDSNGQSSFETITPYLVSRFYRAPEIILGLVPSFAIDLWSLAVTVAELFLGKVLFQGINNNDMLRVMMQHMGPFSNRVIRQHLVQTKKFPLPAHFTQEAAAFYFRQETVDPVSGQPVHKKLNLQSFSASLQSKLLKAKSAKDSRVLVLGFSDLLQKCLTLDPTRRIPVKIALQHDFFFKDTTGSGNTTGGKKKTG